MEDGHTIMKIYANIKAYKLVNGERITVEKGQGSNEWIGIDILTEPNTKHYRINVNIIDNIPIMELYEYKTGRTIYTKRRMYMHKQVGQSTLQRNRA